MARTYRPDIAYPAELTQNGRHFVSGVNSAGEARGLALSARHFGISLADLRTGLIEEIEIYGGGMQELFVDTGAFSEVEFTASGPVVVDEIPHDEWIRRYAIAERLAAAYRTRAMIVAPDRVGCQETTLARMARYGALVAACAAHRAKIIVPAQKGALPMGAFYAKACAILGLREAPIAGIPMKKDATTIADLETFVGTLPWYGAQIHLLGIGPKSKGFRQVIAAIKKIRPNALVTSDSTQAIRGEVGRTNGKGGGARPLTLAQDRARAIGLTGQDVKANALIDLVLAELAAEREAAHAAGWRDVELDDDNQPAPFGQLALPFTMEAA